MVGKYYLKVWVKLIIVCGLKTGFYGNCDFIQAVWETYKADRGGPYRAPGEVNEGQKHSEDDESDDLPARSLRVPVVHRPRDTEPVADDGQRGEQ